MPQSNSIVRGQKQVKLAAEKKNVYVPAGMTTSPSTNEPSSLASIAFYVHQCIEIHPNGAGVQGSNSCLQKGDRSVEVSIRHAVC